MEITIYNINNCPVCNFPILEVKKGDNAPDVFYINCFRCGKYSITDVASGRLPKDVRQKNAISVYLFRNKNTKITSKEIDRLTKLPIAIPPEKADRLLLFLSKRYPIPGTLIPNLWKGISRIFDTHNKPDFREVIKKTIPNFMLYLNIIAECEIINTAEFHYITSELLNKTKGYLKTEDTETWRIAPVGWDHIYSLQSSNRASQSAFVAMRFLPELIKYSDDYILPAIINAGYKPIRVDMEQHNDLIDDRIIAGIRESKFIVADLTENSYGVYFESGFAKGLGLPVIYLCNKKYFEEKGVHFDIGHYPFLLWEDDKGSDLKERLQLRIEATIGKGLYNPEVFD